MQVLVSSAGILLDVQWMESEVSWFQGRFGLYVQVQVRPPPSLGLAVVVAMCGGMTVAATMSQCVIVQLEVQMKSPVQD